ncbi:MAG: ZIP family metal transporter [Chromatocurvus sp.]
MADYPGTLLLFYSAAIAVASLLGGLLPNVVRMTHTRTQLAMSLVSGLMLGVAFYHLLPHSIVMRPVPGAIDFSVRWLVVGLVMMLLLLRAFHFHQHEIAPDVAEGAGACASPAVNDQQHDGAHRHSAASLPGAAHPWSWIGIALGLGLHTLIDGVALGAALRGSEAGHVGGLLGAGVFLAILLHKPLDAMSITALMQSGGWGIQGMRAVNVVFALLCPVGALAFYYGVDLVTINPADVVAAALAFAAGAFICIALSDLLPEVHFHSHDRVKLTTVFLLGLVIAYGIGNLEPAGAHHHEAADDVKHTPEQQELTQE